MNRFGVQGVALLGFFSLFLSFGAGAKSEQFSTLKGLGFDKRASIWLVERQITPSTPVVIFDSGEPPAGTIFFDEPNSKYFRDAEHSTYEKLATQHGLQSAFISYFVATVHDIEIRLWQPDQQADSHDVEAAFRALQERWGRDRVPAACYREFFDHLEQLFDEQQSLAKAQALLPQLSCWKDALASQLDDPKVLVTEMPIDTLFGHIRSGARVGFVDVREPDEFAENHIPGAINLKISDTTEKTVSPLKQYDIVVAYCVKDFRGFEMARKLRDLGIKQSVILSPFGIRGWIASNLPVYKVGAVGEEQAAASLKSCIDNPGSCVKLPETHK